MKARLLTLLLSSSLVAFSQKAEITRTRLYIIGTIHFPSEKITADTIAMQFLKLSLI